MDLSIDERDADPVVAVQLPESVSVVVQQSEQVGN